MTREKTLYTFFSTFMTAYEASTVPDDAALPYLTFADTVSAFEIGEVAMPVNLWAKSTSMQPLLDVEKNIFEAIGHGGIILSFDGGKVWVKRGSPFGQSLTDNTDPTIKRRYINLTLEYFY